MVYALLGFGGRDPTASRISAANTAAGDEAEAGKGIIYNMPRIIVEIEWSDPEEEFWFNPNNIAIALRAYTEEAGHLLPHTQFIVRCVEAGEK